MSVSDPGTATIFTHDVVLCLLTASTVCFMLSGWGGVGGVQKRPCVVPALPPACGAAVGPPPLLQAVATIAREISEAFTPRRGSNVIAFSSVAMTGNPAPSSRWAVLWTGARVRRRRAAITPPKPTPDGPSSKLTLQI